MKSLQSVSHEFSLRMPFVYKCVNEILLLKPHVHRGPKNKKLLDDSGVRIFDRIRELRQNGLSFREIKTQLDGEENDGKTEQKQAPVSLQKHDKTNVKQEKAEVETVITFYTEELRRAHEQVQKLHDQHVHYVQEREQTIQELIRKNEALTGTLKALPEGKSPEEIRFEYHQTQQRKQEAARLLGALKSTTGLLKGKQRKALIEQLEHLLLNE